VAVRQSRGVGRLFEHGSVDLGDGGVPMKVHLVDGTYELFT
jgi:hypothetical protein